MIKMLSESPAIRSEHMEIVWLYDTKGKRKSQIWDAISTQMSRQGYWDSVIVRTLKPSFSECGRLRRNFTLPEKFKTLYEQFYTDLLKDRYMIMDMLIRKTDWGTDRYNSASFHELSNRIRIYFDFALRSLIKDKISLVIFCTVPHMGWDYIFYRCAKFLNIKTLLLDQAKIPNRFFHCFEFEDYGQFKTSKILGTMERMPIEKKVEKDWFYMKKNYGAKPQWSFSKFFEGARYKKRLRLWIENNDCLRLARELVSRKRRPQAFFRYYTEKQFITFKKKYEISTPPLDVPYVYFPLHNQPERSTSIWGGIYVDQVLAVERLALLLPEDWAIYVKENPKQRGAYRDPLFYERLNAIPNVRYICGKVNTHDLTRHSRFVATIIGTAGWEAITGGKNVLVFGWGAWYKTLPGVYPYRDDIDINQLVSNKIDHDELEKKAAEIMNKCGTGIVDLRYLRALDKYCPETSTREVVASIVKILYT